MYQEICGKQIFKESLSIFSILLSQWGPMLFQPSNLQNIRSIEERNAYSFGTKFSLLGK